MFQPGWAIVREGMKIESGNYIILHVNVVSWSIAKCNCILKYYQNITQTIPGQEARKWRNNNVFEGLYLAR